MNVHFCPRPLPLGGASYFFIHAGGSHLCVRKPRARKNHNRYWLTALVQCLHAPRGGAQSARVRVRNTRSPGAHILRASAASLNTLKLVSGAPRLSKLGASCCSSARDGSPRTCFRSVENDATNLSAEYRFVDVFDATVMRHAVWRVCTAIVLAGDDLFTPSGVRLTVQGVLLNVAEYLLVRSSPFPEATIR